MHSLGDRLATVFDSVADGVAVLDRTGRIRFANEMAAQLLGRRSAAELIGATGAELAGEYILLDEDGEVLDPARMPTRRALAGELEPGEVVRFRRRGSLDDQWSMVRSRLLPGTTRDEDLVVTAFQDITPLKRSEARLRFLAEASAILAESVDYQQTLQRVADISVPRLADWCVVDVLEWTRGVSRVAIAHANPEGLALVSEIWERWPPDPASHGAVYQVLQAGRPILMSELTTDQLQAAARDEEHLAMLRRLELRSALIVPLQARGEILGALTLAQSQSGRRLEDADLEVATELGRRAGATIDVARLVWEAQASARLREEFIAVASHDMRTPLAAVRGYAQLALRHLDREPEADPESLRRWLRDIDSSVDRLAHLVSELLDASLVRADQPVPLQLAPTTLGSIVREVVERHGELTDGHEFSVQVPPDEPEGMWDRERLVRVVDNLVGNAIKFSPDGGEVRLESGERDGRAFIAVSDEGIGIPASERHVIFNPMHRGGNVGQVIGTGLGLSGSRRLIEMMGGTIEVSSQLSKGSTFTVWLPISSRAEDEGAPGI
jgi:PAS domain S-box-containing protein